MFSIVGECLLIRGSSLEFLVSHPLGLGLKCHLILLVARQHDMLDSRRAIQGSSHQDIINSEFAPM